MAEKRKLKKSLKLEIYEEDGSIFARVDNKKDLLLGSDKDINLKTNIAVDRFITEVLCDLENFQDRPNYESLCGLDEEEEELKKGRA